MRSTAGSSKRRRSFPRTTRRAQRFKKRFAFSERRRDLRASPSRLRWAGARSQGKNRRRRAIADKPNEDGSAAATGLLLARLPWGSVDRAVEIQQFDLT